jgi:hypothetical protein
MKLEYLVWIGMILMLVLGGAMGYLIKGLDKNVIEQCSTQAKLAGLWLPDIQTLKNYNGKYICVNVDETKTLTELERVCEHEVGHEIFARECETNFTKCAEMIG